MSAPELGHGAEKDAASDVCAFALHRGRYCMRPAGHEATDGRVARHDSTGMPPPTCWRSECRNGCYYGPEACSVTRNLDGDSA